MLAPASQRATPQRLRRTLQPALDQAAALPGMDRYRKVFPALAHLWILVLHVLEGSPSLRQTHARLRVREHLWQTWGMLRFVSRCQLTRSTTSRPLDGALHLFSALFAQAQRRPVQDPDLRLLLRLEAVDSTFIRLSEKLAPWSKHGKAAAGLFVQCGFDLARSLPTWLELHGREANDRGSLAKRDLSGLQGWTLIFDKGYYAHTLFARLLEAQVDFITRRYEPAVYAVRQAWSVTHVPLSSGERLLADLLIDLGSPNNRTSTVVRGVRLIQYYAPNGELHELLTSRLDLTAGELVQLYRKRWRVPSGRELFFRFLKRQLGMIRPLGYSREALRLTVLIVAIVAVLLVLVEPQRPADETRVAWARALAVMLADDLIALRL
jgi:hypothetical protein